MSAYKMMPNKAVLTPLATSEAYLVVDDRYVKHDTTWRFVLSSFVFDIHFLSPTTRYTY